MREGGEGRVKGGEGRAVCVCVEQGYHVGRAWKSTNFPVLSRYLGGFVQRSSTRCVLQVNFLAAIRIHTEEMTKSRLKSGLLLVTNPCTQPNISHLELLSSSILHSLAHKTLPYSPPPLTLTPPHPPPPPHPHPHPHPPPPPPPPPPKTART